MRFKAPNCPARQILSMVPVMVAAAGELESGIS